MVLDIEGAFTMLAASRYGSSIHFFKLSKRPVPDHRKILKHATMKTSTSKMTPSPASYGHPVTNYPLLLSVNAQAAMSCGMKKERNRPAGQCVT